MKVQQTPTTEPSSVDDVAALDPFGGPTHRGGMLVWGIDLPEDPAAAEDHLAAAEQHTRAVDGALGAVPDRIELAVERSERPRRASFGVGPQSPEDALADSLRAERRSSNTSFGLGEITVDQIKGLTAKVQARLDGLLDVARNAARVETRVGGRLVAASTLGWLGDANTVLATNVDDATVLRHERTVALVVRSRQSRLRFVIMVLSGAARIAASVAGGGLAALPTIYTFVNQVIDEFDAMQAAQKAAPEGGSAR